MKKTKFMRVMFSAVENGDEELTSQVANDIETAKAEGSVDTDEVSYANLGEGKVLVLDKVNGEATIAEMPEDEASTYDLTAVPDEELDQFLYPMEDGVTPDGNVHDFIVDDEYAPLVAGIEAPNAEEYAEEHLEDVDQDDQIGEQHEFSVSTDNTVVQRIFSDVAFYDRLFSETIESEETSVVGDLKIEKVDDDSVIVTSESTGDQAKVTLDDDEMEVTELDQKEMSYYDDEEPALYSVVMNEDEMALLQYLFSDDEEGEYMEEGDEDLEDVGEDEGPDAYNPLYVVGVDADNHQIVDAPVYTEEDAQELAEHLTEIGVDDVNVFDDPSQARDYASELLTQNGVTISEVEQTAAPEEHQFSDYTIYTTRFYCDDEMELSTNFMERCYAENAETDKIEDAISNGDQVETDNEIITPVDSETAVVEDKNSGEFTKATLDEDGGVEMEAIDEDEADELTDGVTTEAPEEDEEEDEKEFSVHDEFEFMTNFAVRLYSEDEEAHEEVEDALESGEEVETSTEVVTPVSDDTVVIEDKKSGEYTKVTVDGDNFDTEAISKEEAEELFSYIEVEPTAEETSFRTATRFFADAMQPAPQGQPAQQMMAAQAPQGQPVPGENPDPNAIPVDENGNPIDPAMLGQDPAVQSVEAIEDKALVAVQSIQAAANDAVMAIQQAKEAPAPQAQQDLQEAQFSNYYDEDDYRMFAEYEDYGANSGDTLSNWLGNLR